MVRLISTLIALLSLCAQARKTYFVKTENNLKLQPPVVQATKYDCSGCYMENDNDYICADWGMDWELGWNWYQEQEDDVHYRMRLELYTK